MPAYKGRWNVNWTKAGAILAAANRRPVPPVLHGRRARPSTDQTGIASSTDLVTLEATRSIGRCSRAVRGGSIRASPSRGRRRYVTDEIDILIYNGADDRLVYRTGWALFDRQDPTRLLARSEQARCSSPRPTGRRSARSRTWCSSRAWSSSPRDGSSTTAAPTSTSASPR